jgi:hypothetical protein
MSQKNAKSAPTQSTDDLTIQDDENKKDCESGAPVERYHGEKTNKRVGGEGDLDEETLDEDAPFNKTYGREKSKSTNEKN